MDSAGTPIASLRFETPEGEISVQADAVVLALGGGSWPITGSTGAWVPLLAGRGVAVAPLKPSNCGFDVAWTEHFRSRFAGHPLKSVVLSFTDMQGNAFHQQGEFVITETGVEGSLIYACSALLRDEIEAARPGRHPPGPGSRLDARTAGRAAFPAARLTLHGEPSRKIGGHQRASRPGCCGSSYRRPILPTPKGWHGHQGSAHPADRGRARSRKPSAAPAVSTFEALDEHLMLRSLPGVFCAGEMLDWEAPTGGYLLTACFASGRAAGLGALEWLGRMEK